MKLNSTTPTVDKPPINNGAYTENNINSDPQELKATPLPGQPKFGKQLKNFDLKSATDSDIAHIKELLCKHGLVVFRDQTLADQKLISLAQSIGSGEIEPPAKAFNSPDGKIAYLTNLKKPDGSPLGFPAETTDVWHADSEFRESGGSLAMLYCLVPTASGGETSFATTAVDHLNIDDDELAELRELWSTRKAAKIISHPVIETNNKTGSEYLYISENTKEFINRDGETLHHSEEKTSRLLEKILKPENIYTHDWQQGDLVLYDNMQSIHRREEYQGIRFLKVVKFHSDGEYIVAPIGKTLTTPA